MPSQIALVSATRRWTGRTLSGLAVAFLLFDGVVKLLRLAPVIDAFAHLQLPDRLAAGLGALELACVALYTWPRTAALGAALVTGFLGGAVALHLRVGDPLLSHVLFPTYVGALLWGGLALRDPRLRALICA